MEENLLQLNQTYPSQSNLTATERPTHKHGAYTRRVVCDVFLPNSLLMKRRSNSIELLSVQ